LRIKHHPEEAKFMAEAESGESSNVIEAFEDVDLSGAKFFINAENGNLDDFFFRGTIQQVELIEDFLGQSGWKVQVIPFKQDDKDLDLKVLIMRRVWR
jgi:hypothetical protein